MNIKRKAFLCVIIVLFCSIANLHAQESYVSQSDIDNFIANFDALENDEVMDNPNVQLSEPATVTEFVVGLENFKAPFATALQKHGLNNTYPVEAFYTILVGTLALQLDAEMEVMLLQVKTEKERQMVRNEMTVELNILTKLKESIHPDDLRLLIENFRFLNVLFSF